MARRNPDDEILIAADSAVVNLDGELIQLHRDVTRVRASHDLAKQFPGLFKPIDVHYDVEQATASPGEKRGKAAS